MLRGSITAKIDDKGRLKVPNAFRSAVTDTYGDLLYVTSVTGESVLIYPMSVWEGIEEKLKGVPSTLPARRRYVDRVNYYGQPAEFDRQGRVSIHARLRESAEMLGEVDVFGYLTHLEVWNHERFVRTKLQAEALTPEDYAALAEYGI